MSTAWKVLSWKQKDAVKIALQRDEKITLRFLRQDIYSDDKKARKAIEKLRKNGFIEPTDIGNKYEVVEDKVPDEVLKELAV